jgi:hypothetical protein
MPMWVHSHQLDWGDDMLIDQGTSLSNRELTLCQRTSMNRLPRCHHLLIAQCAHLTCVANQAGLVDISASC